MWACGKLTKTGQPIIAIYALDFLAHHFVLFFLASRFGVGFLLLIFCMQNCAKVTPNPSFIVGLILGSSCLSLVFLVSLRQRLVLYRWVEATVQFDFSTSAMAGWSWSNPVEEIGPTVSHAVTPGWMCMTPVWHTQFIFYWCLLGMNNSFILPTVAHFGYNFSNIMNDKHGKLISGGLCCWINGRSPFLIGGCLVEKEHLPFWGHLIIWSSYPISQVFYSSQHSKNLRAGLLMISAAWMLSKHSDLHHHRIQP